MSFCCVQKVDDDDGDIYVCGYRCVNEMGTHFQMKENYTATINFEQIIALLPTPEIKVVGRAFIYIFDGSVGIFEKQSRLTNLNGLLRVIDIFL